MIFVDQKSFINRNQSFAKIIGFCNALVYSAKKRRKKSALVRLRAPLRHADDAPRLPRARAGGAGCLTCVTGPLPAFQLPKLFSSSGRTAAAVTSPTTMSVALSGRNATA